MKAKKAPDPFKDSVLHKRKRPRTLDSAIITLLDLTTLGGTAAAENLYVGIDPGKSGAIVFLRESTPEGHPPLYAFMCSDLKFGDMAALLPQASSEFNIVHAVMEEVNLSASFNRSNQPTSAGADQFEKAGRGNSLKSVAAQALNVGMWKTVLTLGSVNHSMEVPRSWNAEYKLNRNYRGTGTRQPKNLDYRDHKKRLVAVAKSLYPDAFFSDKAGDGVLLADYCRKNYGPKGHR